MDKLESATNNRIILPEKNPPRCRSYTGWILWLLIWKQIIDRPNVANTQQREANRQMESSQKYLRTFEAKQSVPKIGCKQSDNADSQNRMRFSNFIENSKSYKLCWSSVLSIANSHRCTCTSCNAADSQTTNAFNSIPSASHLQYVRIFHSDPLLSLFRTVYVAAVLCFSLSHAFYKLVTLLSFPFG